MIDDMIDLMALRYSARDTVAIGPCSL